MAEHVNIELRGATNKKAARHALTHRRGLMVEIPPEVLAAAVKDALVAIDDNASFWEAYITVEEAAKFAGISTDEIRRAMKSGTLSYQRKGERIIRIKRRALDEWMQAHTVRATVTGKRGAQ